MFFTEKSIIFFNTEVRMFFQFFRQREFLQTLFLCVAYAVTRCVREDESGSKSLTASITPETAKEAQWEAKKSRLEKEIAALKREAEAARARNESLTRWWLAVVAIVGVLALLGGIGLGSGAP